MIPIEHLEGMGFVEIKKDLYMKNLGEGIKIYRDYRNPIRKSYAYRGSSRLPERLFKELRSIKKIENYMVKDTLLAFY